jgi:hypothetical protein
VVQGGIAQGEKVFEGALQNPDSLAGVVAKGEVCAFEGFGYIAARVWEEKTGLGAARMPGQKATAAKAPDGSAWKDDDDLKQRFPRLWAKFSANRGRRNKTLQQTGHAIDGCARHYGFSRVSRLLSPSSGARGSRCGHRHSWDARTCHRAVPFLSRRKLAWAAWVGEPWFSC